MTVAALPASMVAGVMATVDFERLTAPAAGASAANATKVVPPELVSNDVRFVNALVIFTTKPSVVPTAIVPSAAIAMELAVPTPPGNDTEPTCMPAGFQMNNAAVQDGSINISGPVDCQSHVAEERQANRVFPRHADGIDDINDASPSQGVHVAVESDRQRVDV